MSSPKPYNSSLRMRLIAWLTLGLYFLVAITLTHMPKVPAELERASDKTLHATGYFIYAALAYIAMGLSFPRLRGLAIIVLVFLAGFAACDELTQPMFGRDCDYYDWRADVFGATVAVTLLSLLRIASQMRSKRVAPLSGVGS